jgi:CopG family transcriptional regulator, nickel-responsive regulator
MSSGVSRISISIDPQLLEEFDKTINTIGYNRSTAVQIAMRDFLTEHKWKDVEGTLAGVITLLYDHHVGGITEELTHLQHNFTGVINSTTHIHLDHHNCLEILIVRGESSEIKKLADFLSVIRGIQQMKISLMK